MLSLATLPSLARTPARAPAVAPAAFSLQTRDLCAWFGATQVLHGVSLDIADRAVTALIGPSGCGKSTYLRCLNRMHEVAPGARVQGQVLLGGQDLYAPTVNPTRVRRHVGMVFQKPNPFPMMSIRDNVLAGLRLNGMAVPKGDELVELALRQAALWDEVKDNLGRSGASLSGGQQQRLCIARCLALQPEILLMDEPCSALDPIATARIEDLLNDLRRSYSIVLVTHNMQQAARVADVTAFLYHGQLVEAGPTEQVFTQPREQRTEDYITGRFG